MLPAAQHAAAVVLFSFEIQSYFSASNVYQQIYKELEAKLVKNRKVTLLLRHLDIENSRLEANRRESSLNCTLFSDFSLPPLCYALWIKIQAGSFQYLNVGGAELPSDF